MKGNRRPIPFLIHSGVGYTTMHQNLLLSIKKALFKGNMKSLCLNRVVFVQRISLPSNCAFTLAARLYKEKETKPMPSARRDCARVLCVGISPRRHRCSNTVECSCIVPAVRTQFVILNTAVLRLHPLNGMKCITELLKLNYFLLIDLVIV